MAPPSWTDILTATTTALAAVAAGGSFLAATRANRTAESLARIEAERRHLERTPVIDLDFNAANDGARLHVYLNGPDELRQLDSVALRVEDDDLDRFGENFVERLGGPSREQLERYVWGPFRFSPGIDHADRDGRTVPGFPLAVGKGRPLDMERTRPGSWMGGTSMELWQKQNANNPIRLRLTCRRGDEEWVLTKRVDNPPYEES